MRSVSARSLGRGGCQRCGSVTDLEGSSRCAVCGAGLGSRKADSAQRTLAWLVTAMILYVPANVLPIMRTERLGRVMDSTIISGVIELWGHGSYLVAGIIFFASVLVPMAKIFSLLWLCWLVSPMGAKGCRPQHSRLYELTELVGRWSMIDVFVVAVLVSLVQLGGFVSVKAGPAGLAFAGVVLSTMLAARSFDPRLLWDAIEQRGKERPRHV
ncbi:paraquat-inducible protein A [Pelagicoccus sp. SDUM812003]|nr:paraquat-inducible protein A [Pelagicoccus sp. SDUM812003]